MSQKGLEKLIFNIGRVYIPEDLPDDIPYKQLHHCFDDCAVIALQGKYRYVEGLARNPMTGEWILHAWLTDHTGIVAYDPTWKAIKNGKAMAVQTRYIGVQMNIMNVAKFMMETKYQGVFANAWRSPELARKIIIK